MKQRNEAVVSGLRELNEGFLEAVTVEVNRRVKLLERVLAGETSEDVPEGLEDTFSGVVFDENNDHPLEVAQIREWLDKMTGGAMDELSEKVVLISADGSTRVIVYDKAVGKNEYYLSKWVNEGEKPAYVLWPWAMYEGQLEAGFEEESK